MVAVAQPSTDTLAALDLPLKDARGNIIMRIFRGSSSANVDIKG